MTRYVHSALEGFEATWTYRRTCAAQTSIPAVLGFLLAMEDCGAHEMVFCHESGRACVDGFRRKSGKRNWSKSTESIPFRLTRNIEHLLQPFLLHGIFKSTAGAVLFSLNSSLQGGGLLAPYLYLFLRGEVASISDNIAKDYILGEERAIKDRLTKVAPRLDASSDVSIETQLNELINLAQSPDLIALKDPEWSPWL